MIEEMLHVALVANVINAIGGQPRIDGSTIPRYPLTMTFEGAAFKDRNFPVDLASFSADTISTFLQIEEPQHRSPGMRAFAANISVPGLTIGEFYERIISLMEEIEERTSQTIFIGDPARQIEQDFYWSSGGHVVAVKDLASAKVALDLVITQGEGTWPRSTPQEAGFDDFFNKGHYFRFNEIASGRCYLENDDPTLPPTGPELDVDYGAVYKIKPSPKSADYAKGTALADLNERFNRRYTVLLRQLHEAFNGVPKTLYTAIGSGMHELPEIAHAMMKITLDTDALDLRGCPSFEWEDYT